MNAYWYQLTSSRQLFARTRDWWAYLAARALAKAPRRWTPTWLTKRPFHVVGAEAAVVLRPQTQDFAVAPHTGIVHLQRSHRSLGHRTSHESLDSTVEVPAVSVDEILRRMDHHGPIDLLKCDIEGAEDLLFADCRSWIHRVRILVVEVHGNYRIKDLQADLDENGGRFQIEHTDSRQAHLTVACLRSVHHDNR